VLEKNLYSVYIFRQVAVIFPWYVFYNNHLKWLTLVICYRNNETVYFQIFSNKVHYSKYVNIGQNVG
jgi:hypothetical protein